MRTFRLFALLLLLAVFPISASAEIFINEIAWMGTDANSSCEWIELHNDSDDIVSLQGWALTILNKSGSTKTISLSGGTGTTLRYSGIASNGYYLIAHDTGSASVDCESSDVGEAADWLGNMGSMSNDGAKITLTSPSGEEDVVDAQNGWTQSGIGGSNTSPKKTAQRQGSQWITEAPTPRGPNRSAPLEELPEEEEDDTPPVVTVGGTAPLVPVVHPVPKLYVDGGPSRIVVAGADTFFSAIAYDSVGDVRKNADISWTFGEGGQERGEEVWYAYKKPGTYTAVVRAKDKGVSAVSLLDIVVVDAGVVIDSITEEGVVLRNTTKTLTDLSGWKLSLGKKTIKLPLDTVIAGESSTFLPFENLRVASSSVGELKFPNGRVAHAYTKPSEPRPGLYPLQEKPLALVPATRYAHAVPAPTAQPDARVVGASSSQTVILKTDTSFMAGVIASLRDIFSR